MLAAAVAACMLPGARAQGPIRCSAFLHNADGSWTSFDEATVLGSFGPVDVYPGEKFRRGTGKKQDDVARILDGLCERD